MKAIKGKGGLLNIISKEEYSVYQKIANNDGVQLKGLTERETYLVDEMYRKNVLRRVEQDGRVYFLTYPQKEHL